MAPQSYDEFFYDLRISESGNDYSVVNSFGFLGAYQFGEAALVDLGLVTRDGNPFDNVFDGQFTGKFGVFDVVDFLSSVEAQDSTADEWFDLLWRRIRFFDLEIFDGQTLNGVSFTASGMIAGAHLGGVGGVRDLIESGGFTDPADAFGTSITDYVERFAGYDVPAAFVNNLDKDNRITGGDGDDGLYGYAGADTLAGAIGNDEVFGGDGGDLLFGDAVVDVASLISDLGL